MQNMHHRPYFYCIKINDPNEYLISLTYSRIWLKFVFLPMVSLHAAPMQKRVLPASFACKNKLEGAIYRVVYCETIINFSHKICSLCSWCLTFSLHSTSKWKVILTFCDSKKATPEVNLFTSLTIITLTVPFLLLLGQHLCSSISGPSIQYCILMTEGSKNNLHCIHQSLLKEVCIAALLWICAHFCGPEPETKSSWLIMRKANGTSELMIPY